MNQKERMLANLPYRPMQDGLAQERRENRARVYVYNQLPPERWDEQETLLRRILGSAGTDVYIHPPFHCDYGYNIHVGDGFYANTNLTVLDVGQVRIGNGVMFGPNVALYTAGHPVHPETRKSGYEYGIDITIGNNVWIGGNTVVLPGVNIGDNTVIGAGSVVTRDIPSGVVAAGNPCRVLRPVTEEDRDVYFRDRRFDVEDYR